MGVLFFLDLVGHVHEARIERALAALRPRCLLLKVLGSYPARRGQCEVMTLNIIAEVPEWIRSLAPYPPGKPIEELEREYGIFGSIKLASNENPLGPSPKAVAAVQRALGNLHRYPDGDCFYLKRAVAKKLGVSPDALIFGNGSNEIIELAVRTFLQRGDEAVMADQAFAIYRIVVQAAGGTSRIVPLRNFTHDLDAIADAITPATRLVFLANPNNPTGTIFFRREWEDFLSAVPPHVIVVMDEAYFEFVEDPAYPDSLAAHGKARAADHPAHVLEDLRARRPAHRLRRRASGADRGDEPRAPAVQRQQPGAGRGAGGA